MKNLLFFLSFILINGCKEYKNETTIMSKEEITLNSLKANEFNNIVKDTLVGDFDFKKILNTVKGVKHTGIKHQDWMSNRARTLDSLFLLNNRKFFVKTTSYEYKGNLKFYVHNIKHIRNTVSIKSFIENAQGKTTRGYTKSRILLFAMLNDKEANFIDIPEKLNPLHLRDELVALLYQNIDSDIILCHRAKKCVYKDLRKTK